MPGPAKGRPGTATATARSFSAGEPGNPKKPARIVQVTMGEQDGKMLFVPARLEVKKGEQIKFVLRNNGELEHEFVLASTADNLKHAEEMEKNPDMAHEEPNGKTARPEEDRRDGLEIHQGGRVRICLPDPGSPRSGNDRDDRRQVMSGQGRA